MVWDQGGADEEVELHTVVETLSPPPSHVLWISDPGDVMNSFPEYMHMLSVEESVSYV